MVVRFALKGVVNMPDKHSETGVESSFLMSRGYVLSMGGEKFGVVVENDVKTVLSLRETDREDGV